MAKKTKTQQRAPRRVPKRDPERAHVRARVAARRVGARACVCTETRPEALLPETVWCAACQRRHQGHSVTDRHHYAAAANDPTTLVVPVNDHRADLTTMQLDWPQRTRDNPDGSPALAGAAVVRGFIDTVVYLIKRGLLWVAETLEALDAALVKLLGSTWWKKAGLPTMVPAR